MNYTQIRNYLFGIVFLCSGLAASEGIDTKSLFVTNIVSGSFAGTAEAFCNQPTIVIKNILQQAKSGEKKPNIVAMIRNNPKILSTGLWTNILAQGPATAVQVWVDGALKEYFSEHDFFTAVQRNIVTGIASGASCNATELIIINQLNINQENVKQGLPKKSAVSVIKQLYQKHGKAVFVRGIGPKMIRDAGFCLGFLTLYGQTKEALDFLPAFAATIGASALVGIPTSLITHPFDTISTRLQADPGKKQYRTAADVFLSLLKNGQIKDLSNGCKWRAFRVFTAIPIMTFVKDNTMKLFEK
jgi:hypothetical protein